MVTPTPKAIDSPAEPVVWTMLFSRIVAGRVPSSLEAARNSVIDRTATGIDAETVIPTRSTRYSDDAPKMIPRIDPRRTPDHVSSGIRTAPGTYGWCASDGDSGRSTDNSVGRGGWTDMAKLPPG